MNVDSLHRASRRSPRLARLPAARPLPDTPAKEAAWSPPSPRRTPSPQAIANAQRLAGAPGSTPRAAARRRRRSSLRTFADVSRDAKEHARPVPPLAEGREGLARDRARSVRAPVLLLDQPRPGPGREPLPRGLDDSSLSRRFGGPAIVVFRKVGNNVQLDRAQRQVHGAGRNARGARGRRRVLRQPARHGRRSCRSRIPERKSVLVEANALFFADLPGAAPRLEQAYRAVVRVRRAQLVVPRGAQHAPTSSRSTSPRTTRSRAS